MSNVKLISWSQSPEFETLEDQIAYCARVSNPANQNNKETATRLIKYLIKHKHWSPFEMANICLEIETTRDIGRQILRHRSFSFQEFSQRYAEAQDFTLREARLQDTANRQNSLETEDRQLEDSWYHVQEMLTDMAVQHYHWALSVGIAKEQARAILPEGLTMSRMYMNGTVRSWIHYIQLRSGPETQKEHREIAIKCKEAISDIFPLIKEVT